MPVMISGNTEHVGSKNDGQELYPDLPSGKGDHHESQYLSISVGVREDLHRCCSGTSTLDTGILREKLLQTISFVTKYLLKLLFYDTSKLKQRVVILLLGRLVGSLLRSFPGFGEKLLGVW